MHAREYISLWYWQLHQVCYTVGGINPIPLVINDSILMGLREVLSQQRYICTNYQIFK